MTIIKDILDSEACAITGRETRTYLEFVHDLTEYYTLYDADMRISGLYYRTNTVDIGSMYEVAKFTELGDQCDIRNAIRTLGKVGGTERANELYVEQLEHVFKELCAEERIREFPFADEHELRFEREPRNSHDENAIKIFYQDEHCGYVPKEHAAIISNKYSKGEIAVAIGIIRKRVGDARVTFDIYLPKKEEDRKQKKSYVNDFDEFIGQDDFSINDEKKEAQEVAEYLYEGKWRFIEGTGYCEEYIGGKWQPVDLSWRYNAEQNYTEEFSKAAGQWRRLSEEEKNEKLKKILEDQKARDEKIAEDLIDENKIATTGYVAQMVTPVDPSVIGLDYVGTIEPTNPAIGMVKWEKDQMLMFDGTQWTPMWTPTCIEAPVLADKKEIDYRDYTGFLRTILEYATFAHIR